MRQSPHACANNIACESLIGSRSWGEAAHKVTRECSFQMVFAHNMILLIWQLEKFERIRDATVRFIYKICVGASAGELVPSVVFLGDLLLEPKFE